MIGLALLWALAVIAVVVAQRHPMRKGSVAGGAVMAVFRIYAKVMQRVRYEGEERIPLDIQSLDIDGVPTGESAPLIVVANHTAGIDPVLIQAGLPFEVRWMMAQDMRVRCLQWFWDLGRMIFVDREKPGPKGMREAFGHLAQGGVLGVFPEGAIERPPRHIMPFKDGIGLLIKRSGARLLPVVIEGTPESSTAWGSIWRRGRVTMRFLPVMSFTESGNTVHAITRELEAMFCGATGWPMAAKSSAKGTTDRLMTP